MSLVSQSANKINIVQGEFAVSADASAVITTILGSCVSVCLYDPVRQIGGMNHIFLPGDTPGHDASATGRLGVHLMELLINGLLKLGAQRERLQAKIFGGARTVKGLSDIGRRNVEFSTSFLAREGIEVLQGSTGGEQGRKLQFIPTTGKVRVQLVAQVRDTDFTLPPALVKTVRGGEVELFN